MTLIKDRYIWKNMHIFFSFFAKKNHCSAVLFSLYVDTNLQSRIEQSKMVRFFNELSTKARCIICNFLLLHMSLSSMVLVWFFYEYLMSVITKKIVWYCRSIAVSRHDIWGRIMCNWLSDRKCFGTK